MRRKKKDDVWMGYLVLLGLPIFIITTYPWIIPIIALIIFLCFLPKIIKYFKQNPRIPKKASGNLSPFELKDLSDKELYRVDIMEGFEFEDYVAKLLKYNGYSGVKRTKFSGDYGVDVIAYKDNTKYAFQCKRFIKNLGVKPVQEVSAGLNYYKADVGIVITNAYFTRQAQILAAENNIILYDRDKLKILIQNYVSLAN